MSLCDLYGWFRTNVTHCTITITDDFSVVFSIVEFTVSRNVIRNNVSQALVCTEELLLIIGALIVFVQITP